jgi:hypothetical protein
MLYSPFRFALGSISYASLLDWGVPLLRKEGESGTTPQVAGPKESSGGGLGVSLNPRFARDGKKE